MGLVLLRPFLLISSLLLSLALICLPGSLAVLLLLLLLVLQNLLTDVLAEADSKLNVELLIALLQIPLSKGICIG